MNTLASYLGAKHLGILDDAKVAQAEVIDELTRYKAAAMVDPLLGDTYRLRKEQLVALVARVPVRESAGGARPAISIGLTRR